jgi:hypothetical protein
MSHGRPAAHRAANLIAPAGDPEAGLGRAVAGILAAAGMNTGNGPTPLGAAA